MSKFEVLPPPPPEFSSQFIAYENKLISLLYNRGIKTVADAEVFLNPSYDSGLHDPFLLADMEKAVARILSAINNNERIIIYSDYDCDGIPGAVILHDFFIAIGFTNFYNYIPHRHFAGFGLSEAAVLKLKEEQNPSLIITIDCGTSDFTAITLAQESGIDVIVTDHHEPKETLPAAFAVVNPKIGNSYPFSGLCGAAVIYKVVQALIIRGNFAILPGQEKWWLDMVGIATIADMVSLTNENRVLAHYGLMVLRKSRRPGLQQLLRQQKTSQQYLSEDDIGFTIGPRINAASRMDAPEAAFHLLATKDEGEAGMYLQHLEKLNQERKTAVALMTREIHARLKTVSELPPVIVLGNPDWRPSLVGLAASKLAEENNRPAFLWGRDGNGILKGSCRSGGGISVVTLMQAIPEVFHEFGGHHMSGGFSVRDAAIHELASSLERAYEVLGAKAQITQPIQVDMELTLDEINRDLLKLQKRCAPFGADNPKPIYLIKNVTPVDVSVFGKAKEHLKLTFTTAGLAKEAVAFFKGIDQFTTRPTVTRSVSVLAFIEESFFMNRLQTRLRIIDII